jgi:hypothetical protein
MARKVAILMGKFEAASYPHITLQLYLNLVLVQESLTPILFYPATVRRNKAMSG